MGILKYLTSSLEVSWHCWSLKQLCKMMTCTLFNKKWHLLLLQKLGRSYGVTGLSNVIAVQTFYTIIFLLSFLSASEPDFWSIVVAAFQVLSSMWIWLSNTQSSPGFVRDLGSCASTSAALSEAACQAGRRCPTTAQQFNLTLIMFTFAQCVHAKLIRSLSCLFIRFDLRIYGRLPLCSSNL